MTRDEAIALMRKHVPNLSITGWEEVLTTRQWKDIGNGVIAAILKAAQIGYREAYVDEMSAAIQPTAPASVAEDDAELMMAIGYFIDNEPPSTLAGATERIIQMQYTLRQAADRIAALSAQPTYEAGRRSMQEEAAKSCNDSAVVSVDDGAKGMYDEGWNDACERNAASIMRLKP